MEKTRGHKLLLALVSPVFKQEFYGSPSDDVDKDNIQVVNVGEEFPAEVFKTMIKIIYESQQKRITVELAKERTENLFVLLNLSDRYKILGID